MLVPAASRAGAVCIYCTFRHQQLRREAIRVGRAIHIEARPKRSSAVRVTRFLSRSTLEESRSDSPWDKAAEFHRNNRKSGGRRRGRQHEKRDEEVSLVRQGRRDVLRWTKPESFSDALSRRLSALKEELSNAPLLKRLRKDDGADSSTKVRGIEDQNFSTIWQKFSRIMLRNDEATSPTVDKRTRGKTSSIHQGLRDAWTSQGEKGLDQRIKYEFYAHITNARFKPSDIRNQQTLADLRYPSEWFPATRMTHRKIHLHVGPTNSGKTYHALQRLEQATTGVYAGPLRLLAHEVYTRMNAKGKPCGLITGEERRAAVDEDGEQTMKLRACTVEMVPLNADMDVAVIDEIQMIGNSDRGWAWTQALLGVKAAEVHLCGEERTVPLLKQICASLGEALEIHRYERLTPLEMASESLDGEFSKLRKGDCIVSFSVMGIHSLRRQIERATGKKVATVYGSLPPETRAQQARLFNDPDNDYDYLVASDAVGMGLNLAIKRMIFESASKFNGYKQTQLAVADIKQIAGRAGRYRTADQATRTDSQVSQDANVAITAKGDSPPSSPTTSVDTNETTGFVTTLRQFDFPIVQDAMKQEPEPILTAGIFPPEVVVERFAGYFPPGTPFSYILTRLHELSQMHSRFHLCGLRDHIYIADLIEPIEDLTVADRIVLCAAPVSTRDHDLWKDVFPAFARCVANQKGGDILDITKLPLETLEAEVSASREYLRELENLHKGIVCYLWLSFRFAGVFGQRALAEHIKGLVEEKIEKVLGSFSFSEAQAKKIAAKREKEMLREMAASKAEQEASAVTDEHAIVEDAVENVDESTDGADQARIDAAENLLQDQTSLISSGDRFGGEQDLGIVDEPLLADDEPVTTEQSTSKTSEGAAAPTTIHDATDREPPSDQTTSHNKKPEDDSTTGYNQFGVSLPPKHLAHLETNVTELERNVTSRP